nr:hypothetical protein CFP56_76369 [Quercus suber]
MLRFFRQCLSGSSDNDEYAVTYHQSNQSVPNYLYRDMKPTLSSSGQVRLTKEELADRLVSTMREATRSGAALQQDLANVVHEAGWWNDFIAERALFILAKLIEAGGRLGPAMLSAFHRVHEEIRKIPELAADFAKEHPILTGVICVIIALGILYLLWPSMLEALGFTSLGPRLGELSRCLRDRQVDGSMKLICDAPCRFVGRKVAESLWESGSHWISVRILAETRYDLEREHCHRWCSSCSEAVTSGTVVVAAEGTRPVCQPLEWKRA